MKVCYHQISELGGIYDTSDRGRAYSSKTE